MCLHFTAGKDDDGNNPRMRQRELNQLMSSVCCLNGCDTAYCDVYCAIVIVVAVVAYHLLIKQNTQSRSRSSSLVFLQHSLSLGYLCMNHFEFCLQIHKFTGMKRRIGYDESQGWSRKGRPWIIIVSNGEKIWELEWVQCD